MKDACSLVDAFRAKQISPVEALDMSLEAIEKSNLNAFAFLDAENARKTAENADVYLPFGGVPAGVKELDPVLGWPNTGASLLFKDRIANYEATYVTRFRESGAVFVGQTTASEFGGINCTHTKLHGTTHNPWKLGQTPGGSSGGSAAAVSSGLVPIATGGDGGGSIRIPAGFTGLVGLKVTYGRVPKGPNCEIAALTAVLGCLSRSVRDTARFLDVTNGYSTHDPLSLPKAPSFEARLGTLDLGGLKVVVTPDLFSSAYVNPKVAEIIESAAALLIKNQALKQVDVPGVNIPTAGMGWAASNLVGLYVELEEHYPACADDLTPEINLGLNIATHQFNLSMASEGEAHRRKLNEAMAKAFDGADLIITSTNPDTAFNASGPLPTIIDGVDLIKKLGFIEAVSNNGALTIPGNMYGCPGISVPVGTLDGLPVGMQIMAKHHNEDVLLDLALSIEKNNPWQLTAPGGPH